MITVDRLIQTCNAPLVPLIPLVTAAVGVGATIYTQKKQEEAAQEARAMEYARGQSRSAIGGDDAKAEMTRIANEGADKRNLDDTAEYMQNLSQDRMAKETMRQQELEKRLAQKSPEATTAAKFQPGRSGGGEGSSIDFLVPSVESDDQTSGLGFRV